MTHEAGGRSPWGRRVLVVVVVIACVAWLVGERPLVPRVWHQMRTADPDWLVVMMLATVAAVLNIAMFHSAAQRAAGMTTRPLELLQPATTANGLNMITKSGGLAGMAPMMAHARRTGRSPTQVVAAYLLVALVGQWTFAVLLAATLVMLSFAGDLTASEIGAGALFALIVAAQLVVLVAAVGRSTAPRPVRRVARVVVGACSGAARSPTGRALSPSCTTAWNCSAGGHERPCR